MLLIQGQRGCISNCRMISKKNSIFVQIKPIINLKICHEKIFYPLQKVIILNLKH